MKSSTTTLRPRIPEHYNSTIEPWDVIKDWKLGFHDGSALKYIKRQGTKVGTGNLRSDDLRKAIENLEELYRDVLKEESDG